MFRFRDLTIARKILMGFACLMAISAAGAGMLLHENRALQESLDRIQHKAELLDLAMTADRNMLEAMTYVGQAATAADPGIRQGALAAVALHRQSYIQSMEGMQTKLETGGTRSELQAIQATALAIKAPNERVAAYVRAGQRDEAAAVFAGESMPGLEHLQAGWNNLTRRLTDDLATALDQGRAEIRMNRRVALAASLAGLAAAIVLGLGLARGLVRPIRHFMEKMQAFANADFTTRVEVDSADEVGQLGLALNGAIKHLRGSIHEVADAAATVASGANQLSATSEEMARATQEIAQGGESIHANTSLVAGAMEQLQASVAQVAGNVGTSLDHALVAVSAAEAGIQASQDAEQRMDRIHKATADIARASRMIQELANQTNLLSLNSAIEAAKAGEHGKGFSVVAEEVRKLAELSRQATLEINAIIDQARQAVEDAIGSTRTTSQHIHSIHATIEALSKDLRVIGGAAQEQTVTVADISTRTAGTARDLGQASSAAQELAATVEQVNRTAAELSRVSDTMRSNLHHFRLA